MFQWLILIAVAVSGILLLVWLTERHRRKSKLSRFAGRNPVELNELVRTSFPGCDEKSESLIYWWNRSASVLGIDGRLLRKEDRFDGVLAPVKGYPTDDEIEELGAMVEELVPGANAKLMTKPLNTFGEYVSFLAEHSPVGIKAK